MKLLSKFCLLSFLIFGTKNAYSDCGKFAVVNIQKVTKSSIVFQNISDQVNNHYKEMNIKYDAKAKEIMKAEKSLQKKANIVKQDALKKDVNNFNAKKQKIQEEFNNDRQRLEKAYVDTMSIMQRKMVDAIEKYAKDKKYCSIFETSTLVYNSLDDISDDIIKAMNNTITSYKIDFSEEKTETKPKEIANDTLNYEANEVE